MKRAYFETEIISPPISPNKTPNYGQNHVSLLIIPYSKAQPVVKDIACLLNELNSYDYDMRDDFVVDKPGKILMFLDAQGKLLIDEIYHELNQNFKMPVVFVTSGSVECQGGDDLLYATGDEGLQLSKYFTVLDPLGGGAYPMNRLIVVSNDLVRVNIPLRLNYNNPFERFGVGKTELPGILQEIIPYLY